MNNIFTVFLAPLLFATAVFSAVEFSSLVRKAGLQNVDLMLGSSPVANGVSAPPVQADSPNLYVTGASYEEAALLPLSDPDIAYQAARLLYRTGLLERDPAQRINFFCRSLSQVGEALSRNPASSRLLINWANLRQLLSDVSCSQVLTEGDYECVARYALERDPTNTDVLFSSAQIFQWAGKRQEALGRLRNFLEFAHDVNQRQYDFIEQQLVNAADVSAVVPARFPQIVDWSERLQARKPTLFRDARDALANLQLEAIAKNDAALKAGEIPSQLFFDRLSTLLDVVSSTRVRKMIDSELSRYYGARGQERIQRYLEARQRVANLDVIRAVTYSDTRPFKTSLISWQTEERVTANTFYTSVGFYLPRNSFIETIELVGDTNALPISPISFKFLASDDNQNWIEVTAKGSVDSLEFARHSRLVIMLPPLPHRYWKVHYASSSRDGGFTNRLDSLVKVYGRIQSDGGSAK